MKPSGATKVAAVQTTTSEEKVRKLLHPLQPASTDKENISVINEMPDKMKGDIKKTVDKTKIKSSTTKKSGDKTKSDSKKAQKDGKREGKIMKDKAVQTEFTGNSKTSREDLTSEASPSEHYWQVVAERKQIALHDALEENQMLFEQLEVHKEMLDESRALVEVLQEMVGEDRSDINNSLDDSRL